MRTRIAAGIDVGSRTVKCVMYDGEHIVHSSVADNGYNTMEICQRMLASHPAQVLLATGYGRNLMELELNAKSVTEIKAFAEGAEIEFPGRKTILDIGGQDTKIIRVNDLGRVEKFEMNDRCAAGTGRFLEVMAKTLHYSLDELGGIDAGAKNSITISSMCTVFAESEVISLLARKIDRRDIALALHRSLIQRIAPRITQIHEGGPLVFAGGCALNALLRALLKKELGFEVLVPTHPQITGALGASVLAFREL